jgi:hypothetical protein
MFSLKVENYFSRSFGQRDRFYESACVVIYGQNKIWSDLMF